MISLIKLKMYKIDSLLLGIILLFISCQSLNKKDPSAPKIEIKIWYGLDQHFGNIGNAQRQINILGNIKSGNKQIKAYYTLNTSQEKHSLTLGCDLHRLAKDGDFNIEIERNDLIQGRNIVHCFVALDDKILGDEEVIINYTNSRIWPLPYFIHWDHVTNIQDAVEIVDGEWELLDSGIRTKYKYYDRIIAFGDSSWRNYEVETTVTFHGYNPPGNGPPTYNVSHVAIASRWPGHDKDSLQPNRKWFPLGATSEFRITDNYDSCRWRIFDGENFYSEQSASNYRQIQPEIAYKLKHRVEDLAKNNTLYSVKFWEANEEEPLEWDFQATEISKKRESGSACLIAHNTDVTFGNISVVPIISKSDH